jgi:hypothetical protein
MAFQEVILLPSLDVSGSSVWILKKAREETFDTTKIIIQTRLILNRITILRFVHCQKTGQNRSGLDTVCLHRGQRKLSKCNIYVMHLGKYCY